MEADRRAWLDVQLVAIETQAAALAGEPLPYLEHVSRCFAFEPPRRDDRDFDAAAADIDALLPGDGPLADRLAAWDAQFVIPVDRLPRRRGPAGRPLSRARARRCSGCPTARICGYRS